MSFILSFSFFELPVVCEIIDLGHCVIDEREHCRGPGDSHYFLSVSDGLADVVRSAERSRTPSPNLP
ncbi:hypothetical protein KKF84_03690 [Myxococcota bacterium]|nr:hypothetical protein [Myxococcota bacterium]